MKYNQPIINGIGFTNLLTILFIGLKLANYIDWSWWWILSPIWISICIALSILIIIFVFLALISLLTN